MAPVAATRNSQTTEGRAHEAGANAFLTKPFDFEELLATIERFLVKSTALLSKAA
jgi:DNA-binding response OmpR family regulator